MFSYLMKVPPPTLIKVDRNGTQHIRHHGCKKCGGTGYITGYEHIEGGRCFRCDGSGQGSGWTEKIYTPEYQKVLDERRAKREAAKKAKAIEKWRSENPEKAQGWDRVRELSPTSKFVGEEKRRGVFELIYLISKKFFREGYGYYDASYDAFWHFFEDKDGNIVKVCDRADAAQCGFSSGKIVFIKGTPKHTKFKGECTTVLQRWDFPKEKI